MRLSELWSIACECYLLTTEIRRQRTFFGSAAEAEGQPFLSGGKTFRALRLLKEILGLVTSNVVISECKRAPMNKCNCASDKIIRLNL